MVFERFIKEYFEDYKQQLAVWNPTHGLAVAAAVRMYELDKNRLYLDVVDSWLYWSGKAGGGKAGTDWAVYGNLLFLAHKSVQDWNLTVPKEIETKLCDSDTCYDLWTFWFRYETHLNRRKRYGELVRWVKAVSDRQPDGSDCSYGAYMAALAECYGIMTEEAYDQREVMAALLRRAVKDFSEENHSGKDAAAIYNAAMAAYAVALGIRYGALSKERHLTFVENILLSVEAESMSYRDYRVKFLEAEAEYNLKSKAASACILAYSALGELKKEEKIHGI